LNYALSLNTVWLAYQVRSSVIQSLTRRFDSARKANKCILGC
jgi:hypothetical protein